MRCCRGCRRSCATRWSTSRPAQVTVAQEVETLKLYLEIEKMRFEERLRPHFQHRSRRRSARGCPRCCSSRWSRMRSNMRSPRRRKAPTSRSTRDARGRRGADHRLRHGPGRRAPGWCGAVDRRRPGEHSRPSGAGLWRGHGFRRPDERTGGFSVIIEIPFETDRSRGPQMTIRTILVDDEPLAIQGLQLGSRRMTTSRSSTPAPTAARRSARSRPTSPTSSSSTSRCRASTASR